MKELKEFNPCREAIEFRNKFVTFKEAWEDCPRGDWMLWLAKKAGIDKKLLTLVKGKCAETVKHLMKDERSKKAVDAAIAYGEGYINEEELINAAYAANAAADAAADAADAADAAAYAAYAAYAAAYAAADAAAAAYAANAADAALKSNQKLTSDICRKYLSDFILTEVK